MKKMLHSLTAIFFALIAWALIGEGYGFITSLGIGGVYSLACLLLINRLHWPQNHQQ